MFRFSAAFLLASAVSFAALTRIEIVSRAPVPNSDYEALLGRAYFEVDPNAPANRGIALIDRAPRTPNGMVAFSSDIYIVQPRDPAKSNGTALVEISNRGHKGLNAMFDLNDTFLYDHGFTLVAVGWEFDVPPPNPELLKLYAPVATDNGKTIRGLVRSEWTGDRREDIVPLGDRTQIGYPADMTDPSNRLTVRDRVQDARKIIPKTQWSFTDDRHIGLRGGFDPGRIYELIYRAKDPVVAGLGFAAVRDTVSYLKHGGGSYHVKRAIGFGVSQSGRFLREYLYEGFNADEHRRRVFDGVWSHVAGAGRGATFNMVFAQPSRDGHPFFNVDYPVDIPPFTPEELMTRSRQDNVAPKAFFTNGSYEYWGRAASLIHTTSDSKEDVPPPPNARIYFFAGSQHGAGSVPPKKVFAQNLADSNDYRCAMRALLLAMERWVKDDQPPPPSIYPMISKDQLVSLGAFAFPRIDDVQIPHRKRLAYRFDLSVQPPEETGPPFPTLIPQVDQDGNETSGIRMPEIRVPLASYTGWNLRSPQIGAPAELFSMVGSWIPFARNRTERENNKDPRLSIEERYASKRVYLEKITAAAQELAGSGYLLESDIPKLRDRAAREWDYVETR